MTAAVDTAIAIDNIEFCLQPPVYQLVPRGGRTGLLYQLYPAGTNKATRRPRHLARELSPILITEHYPDLVYQFGIAL